MNPEMSTAFDVFGSELPDEVFTGVFDQPRPRGSGRTKNRGLINPPV
jgi:hypothetical protein